MRNCQSQEEVFPLYNPTLTQNLNGWLLDACYCFYVFLIHANFLSSNQFQERQESKLKEWFCIEWISDWDNYADRVSASASVHRRYTGLCLYCLARNLFIFSVLLERLSSAWHFFRGALGLIKRNIIPELHRKKSVYVWLSQGHLPQPCWLILTKSNQKHVCYYCCIFLYYLLCLYILCSFCHIYIFSQCSLSHFMNATVCTRWQTGILPSGGRAGGQQTAVLSVAACVVFDLIWPFGLSLLTLTCQLNWSLSCDVHVFLVCATVRGCDTGERISVAELAFYTDGSWHAI